MVKKTTSKKSVKKTTSKKEIKTQVKKPIKKSVKKQTKNEELSYIDWKIPVAFIAGILVTVLYYNLPVLTTDTNVIETDLPILYILNDANCLICNSSWIEPTLKQDANVTVKELDINSVEGMNYLNTLGITSLPAAFLSKNFQNSTAFDTYSSNGWVFESGDYYILNIQGTKDLTKQETTNPTVDLFVMSECPYGTPAQKNMINLQKTVSSFDLNIYYIVSKYTAAEMNASIAQLKAQYDSICSQGLQDDYGLDCTDAEWATYEDSKTSSCEIKSDGSYYCSLHGPEELENDMIQICAMNLTENWGDFILNHIDSSFNATYAAESVGLNYTELMNCVNSSLGLELLNANIAVGTALGIGSSPTYIYDNVFTNPSVSSGTVLCTIHPELDGCENTSSLTTATSTGSC